MTRQNRHKLKKHLSPINVWALALGCIIGWGAFVMPGDKFLPSAGPLGTLIALAVAAAIMSVLAINYNYMINIYPEAGGDFTFAKHSFGSRHAFVCSWFLALSYLTIVPLNATALALLGRNLLGSVFQFGYLYTIAGYEIYLGELLLALGAIALFAFVSIFNLKFSGVFQTILAFTLVAGVAVVGIGALTSPEASLSNLTPAFPEGASPIAGILAIVAIAPWCFLGFDTIPQSADEFCFSHRKTKIIMIFSIIFGALVYIVLNTVTASVVPEGYNSWQQYISDLRNLHGLKSLPTFNAAYQLLGCGGLIFLGLAVLAAILSGVIGFYTASSRLLFSMARDGFLPKWFGAVHPKSHTPKNAIIFVMCFSFIAPFFGRSALNWVVDMSAIGAAIAYCYTSSGALKHAVREHNKGIAITGALGILIALSFCVLLLVPIAGLGNALGREAYICLGIWTGLGLIFYFSSAKRAAKE